MTRQASTREYKALSWVFMELFCRGSNFGAASDILRVMILNELGGIYVDHDDRHQQMHGRQLSDRLYRYAGFHHTYESVMDIEIPVNSFFASPASHPFLKLYLDRMVHVYTWLLRCNYKWIDEETRQPMAALRRKDNDVNENWFEFLKGSKSTFGGELMARNFVDFTLFATGPDQLNASLESARLPEVRAQYNTFGPNFPESAKQRGVDIGYQGAWV